MSHSSTSCCHLVQLLVVLQIPNDYTGELNLIKFISTHTGTTGRLSDDSPLSVLHNNNNMQNVRYFHSKDNNNTTTSPKLFITISPRTTNQR